MMVTMILADAAQAIDNKLYILGGGWSITEGVNPVPSAIGLHIRVPWDEANHVHKLRLELVDSDGNPILFPSPIGVEQPLLIETEFEVGRPAGLARGTPIDFSLALSLGPIPLPPGGRFEWRLTIDGQREADWHTAFSTRPLAGQPQPPE